MHTQDGFLRGEGALCRRLTVDIFEGTHRVLRNKRLRGINFRCVCSITHDSHETRPNVELVWHT